MSRSIENFFKNHRSYLAGKIILAFVFASVYCLLAGCHTVSGIGEDIQSLSGKKKPTYNCVPLVNTVITDPAPQRRKAVH